ncbi:hypothetical protein C8J56DRAFT_1052240 [Mycena floridula]|nr:hypothetical protein C8J56DRAFT_1052240 [Mycena floridula]
MKFLNPDYTTQTFERCKTAGLQWYQMAVGFYSDLGTNVLAQINNWYVTKIPGAWDQRLEWQERLPIAHARTLAIMAQKRAEFSADPECPEHDNEQRLLEFLLDRSWDNQNEIRKKKEAVDIVLEALKGLEERMFEYSQAAVIAGNKQWGLNAGPHQDDWNPFITLHP